MNKGFSYLLITSLVTLGIVGCSGGGDSEEPQPTNQKPTANAGQDQTVNEQTQVTLEGAGTDSDGSIANYNWVQLSGNSVELTGHDSANLVFNSPVAKTEALLEFELTVTDNDGATAKDTVQVTVSPVLEEKLIIRGFATEEPIDKAKISMTAFGQEYSTTAGTDGQYELTIEFDEDADTDNEFVILSAEGVGAQDFVSLKSALISITELMSSAGDDGIVTNDEYLPLEISETATAMLALATMSNGNQLPTDKATYQASLKNNSGFDIVSLAAAIKLIVEQSDAHPELELPVGSDTTWALMINELALRKFLAKLDNSFKSDFSTAEQTIIQQLKNRATYTEQPAFYAPLTGAMDYTGSKLDFDNGKFTEYTVVQGASIENISGKLSAELDEATISTGTTFRDVGGFDAQFTEEKVYSTKEYELVQSFDAFDLVIERTEGFYHYENPAYPNYYPDEPFDNSKLVLMAKEAQSVEASDVPGIVMLPLNANILKEVITYNTSYGDLTNNINKNAGSFDINANGTVTGTHSELGDGSWQINNNSNLVLNLANAVITVEKYRDDFVGVTLQDLAGNELGFTTGYTGKRSHSTLWTEADILGFYDLPNQLTKTELGFVLHLKAGGEGDWLRGYDDNGNGIAEAGEYEKDPLLWHLEDGLLVVERYTDLSFSGCLPNPGNPDCFLLNRRELDIFQTEGDIVYVTNNHKFNYHPLYQFEVSEELKALWSFETLSSRYWHKYEEFPLQLEL